MSGVLFRVYIPSTKHENSIIENIRNVASVGDTSQTSNVKNTREYIQFTDCNTKFDSLYSVGLAETSEECEGTSSLVCNPDDVFTAKDEGQLDKLRAPHSHIKQPLTSSASADDLSPGKLRERQRSNTLRFLSDSSQKSRVLPGVEITTMEKVLRKVLKDMYIDTAVWCFGEDKNYYQVIFTMLSGDACDDVLSQLTEYGIGTRLNSIISVAPCLLHYQDFEKAKDGSEEDLEGTDERKTATKTEWERFVASVRARLTVAQVVQGVKSDAILTFDFLALLLVAAFLSALGLVENSTGILVASMLISPLMGPVLAGTFGTVIKDRQLQKLGVRNELLGLLICLLVGCFTGLTIGMTVEHYGNGDWPTEEMLSRGEVHSVWVGVIVALTSGAAVAIATLGDYTGSLVGVAISTSLLPPAVNAGLLWSLACTELVREYGLSNEELALKNNKTHGIYNDYPPADYAILGAVSVCLTLINIFCIFIAGILVLKIKEVTPLTSKEQQYFWHHDVKIARDYNNMTLDGDEANDLGRGCAHDLSGISEEYQGGFRSGLTVDFRHVNASRMPRYTRTQETLHPSYMNQFTWSPSTRACLSDDRLSTQDVNIFTTFAGTKHTDSLMPPMRKLSLGSQWFPGPHSSATSRSTPWYKSFSPPKGTDDSGLPTIPEVRVSQCEQSTTAGSSRTGEDRKKARFVVTLAKDPFDKV